MNAGQISPWSDDGWIEGKPPDRSPCCGDKIATSLADGVLVGTCWKCHAYVCRLNPRTQKQEVPRC